MSLLFRLAFRNVFRNRVRTAIALVAIAMGCSALILNGGIVFNIFHELREDAVFGRYGHLQIYKRGYSENHLHDPAHYLLTGKECDSILKLLQKHPQTVRATRRREFSGLVSNSDHYVPFIGVGVDPGDEPEFSRHDSMKAGRQLAANEPYTVLAGLGLTKKLAGQPGDSLTLMTTSESGILNSIHVRLVGVFEGGMKEFDDWTLKLPLGAVNQLLGDDRTEKIVLLAARTEDVPSLKADLEQEFQRERLDVEIRSWDQLALFHNQVVSLFGRELGVIHLIVGAMVVLGIGNVIGMTILERRVELAAVRAMGVSRRWLAALLFTESLLTGLIGTIGGILLGSAVALAVTAVGIPYPSPPGSTRPFLGGVDIVPAIVAGAAWTSLISTLLAAAFPVWRSVTRPIAAILRHG